MTEHVDVQPEPSVVRDDRGEPPFATSQPSLLEWRTGVASRLTHHLFRFPAKFHPPVVRHLLNAIPRDHVVLDPFCGSGTALVESVADGRPCVGVDVDPLAVFVARAKTRHVSLPRLEEAIAILNEKNSRIERTPAEYQELMFSDLSEGDMESAVRARGLWVPRLPRLLHWFRKYVVVDLAGILNNIRAVQTSPPVKDALLLAFGAIIRNSSNADPVPVSGLEVTAHMRRRDAAGRLVNPFALMAKSLAAVHSGHMELQSGARKRSSVTVVQGDARNLSKIVKQPVGSVITSPPYYNAVDYYRRHLLEMFWLGLTTDEQERLSLARQYIGRVRVRRDVAGIDIEAPGPATREVVRAMERVDSGAARSFRHYLTSMRLSLHAMARSIGAPDGRVVLVVGANRWRGDLLPVVETFSECGAGALDLESVQWYPLKNRYMSYARNNSADISKEYVLTFVKAREVRHG